MNIKFEVNCAGEANAGINSYYNVVEIKTSYDPGGDDGEFEDYMLSALSDWFDGAKIRSVQDGEDEKRKQIERLAAEAYDKESAFQALRMMNTPSDPAERKEAAVRYELARWEKIRARRALEDAMS